MKRLFISTGEVSGDLQGALLIDALRRQAEAADLELEILALGGDRMAQAGAKLLGNTTGIGSIGNLEALPYVWPALKIQQTAKRVLQQFPPDLVVLIDYGGGNLPLSPFIRQRLRVPVVYYIAPQEWVWSTRRTTTRVLTLADHLLAIFPAEAQYYQTQAQALGIPLQVTWVGHPLLDYLQAIPSRVEARSQLSIAPDQLAIVLMPASRQQELQYLLPVMFQAAQRIQSQLPQVHFWVPLALERYRKPLEQAIQHYRLHATLVSESRMVLAAADLVIAKSGTANLETALLNVPQVVVYRVSSLTAWMARHLLKFAIPFMSPPNLITMSPIVPEFLQEQATPDQIAQAALELLLNSARRQQVLDGYQRMRSALGEPGAVERAAKEILQLLQDTSAA